MAFRFCALCLHCGVAFRSAISLKSASTARDRHVREGHGSRAGRVLARRRRRTTDSKRHKIARRSCHTAQAALAASVRVMVLCPYRREAALGLFQAACRSFVDVGMPVQNIRRKQGIDLLRHPEVRRCDVVTRFIVRDFVPAAHKLFEKFPDLRFVWFVEDDCRVKAGTALADLLTASQQAGDCIGWLGYGRRGGEPKVGAHLVSFSRRALMRFSVKSCSILATRKLAFDTLLHALWQQDCVWVPRVSLACQAGHSAKGRR